MLSSFSRVIIAGYGRPLSCPIIPPPALSMGFSSRSGHVGLAELPLADIKSVNLRSLCN